MNNRLRLIRMALTALCGLVTCPPLLLQAEQTPASVPQIESLFLGSKGEADDSCVNCSSQSQMTRFPGAGVSTRKTLRR